MVCDCCGTGCDGWECIYDKLANYDASDPQEKAVAQMIGMYLTSELWADGFGFTIDYTRYSYYDEYLCE